MSKIVAEVLERRALELEREAAFIRDHLRSAGEVLLHSAEHAEQFLHDAYRRAMDFSHPTPFVEPHEIVNPQSTEPSAFAKSLVIDSDPSFDPQSQLVQNEDAGE